MKMPVLPLFLSAMLLHAACAARGRLRSQLAAEEHEAGTTSLHSTIKSMVGAMIEGEGTGKGPQTKDIVRMASGKMELGDAVKRLDGQLPADVASLVRVAMHQGASSEPAYNDDSLQKARRYLNDMMLKGWEELDTVVFECMGFRLRNRGTYDQVVADLCRLGSQIARLGELKVKSTEGITETDNQRKDAEETLATATSDFKTERDENAKEMTVRKNDLAVFDFMLNLTSCDYVEPAASAFIQVKREAMPHMQICDGAHGFDLRFKDPVLQAKMERMMTPAARKALRAALGQTVGKTSLLQKSDTAAPVDQLPVSEEPHPEGQWKKCVDKPFECGLLHDLMSLEWGKFRDSFDELTAEMNHNQEEFDKLKRNINDQLGVISDAKTEHMEALAASVSAFNADVQEEGEKDAQKRQLTEEFDLKCAEFRAKISEILHTKICAVRKVRNTLMTYSTTTPLSEISDCDFTDWHSKTGECIHSTGKAILCDNTCQVKVPYEEYDPYQCGGLETMKRDIVVAPNQNGMVCPPMEMKRRCGQKLCPVDCSVSQWSGWAKCSKDCESGVQGRTRSILIKAKNGGTICDSSQEERACNTGSCDRDCTLQEWTDWAPCSMACNGGRTTRVKKVLVPIRGQGKCPTEDSVERWEEDTCNSQKCQGDEICIAQQDLIIALDSSGSVRQEGFDILKSLAVNLTGRYKPLYHGLEATRIGMVMFGNGQLTTLDDGTTSISEAIEISPLTDDFAAVRTKAEEQTWKQGFTNMAQAFSMAEVLLQREGRGGAQSAVLVLSDGKYSFKYQTAEKVQELKDNNVQIFMAPVISWEDESLETLKEWASQPWETNYERIPGFETLQYNEPVFVEKLLVKFCPDSMSPSLEMDKNNKQDYMMVREEGWASGACSRSVYFGVQPTEEGCYFKALAAKYTGFAWAPALPYYCFGYNFVVTQSDWDTWQANPVNPNPCGSTGELVYNPSYNTYVIYPPRLTGA